MSASVTLDTGDEGVIVACGARTGGHVLYLRDGHLTFLYNAIGRITQLQSTVPVPSGRCELSVEYTKHADHEGIVRLLVGDAPAGETALKTLPWRQTLFGMDIGRDLGSTVTDAYDAPFAFTGNIHFVDYHLSDDCDDLRAAAVVEAGNALVDQ